jgi:hypothetical protein
MRVFIALALVAFAVATVPRHSRIPNPEWLNDIVRFDDERRFEESSFRADREYRYVYNGQLATGIPQSSRQHAATRVQAVVSLVFKTETQVLLKLTHIRMGKMNRDIPNPREMLPFEAFEEAQIVEELEKQLQLPVQFKYTNGLISDITFDGEEKPWSANLKRGVMNMLQVNLKQHGRTDLSEEQRLLNGAQEPATLEDDFFTCQERTLEGDCETYYTITQQPSNKWNTKEQVMNVTKTINFEKCRQRPDIRYNKRFGEQCNTCDRKFANDEKTTESSTVARFNISGTPEQFIIESAVVESQYIFTPLNEQMNVIATYVNQTLQLVKSGPVVTRVQEPSNPIASDSQMIYTPDWDIAKERFFMEGDSEFLTNSVYGEVKNKVEMVEQILRRLVRFMVDEVKGIEEEAPRQLARLVKVLRMCTEQEIEKIHREFFDNSDKIEKEHHQKVKDILVDAMALAGTKNTIKHLVEKTKERKVHPIKAAVALKALVNTRIVSEKQIQIVMDLCKHQVSQRSPVLRQSCYLTVGSMIKALCQDNEDQLAHEFKVQSQKLCPLQLKQRYVKELIEMFTQSESKYEKVLSLKTLANAGLDMSIFELEKIIKNTGLNAPHETIVRTQAIDALRQLRSQMPRKIQKVLMPVYKNQQEVPEIRMNAIAQIMQTQPERAILDQLAQQLTLERSQQVVSFVYTMLRTFANSTNPCEKRVAEDLQLALRHARNMPLHRALGKSSYIHLPFYSTKYNLGASLNLGAILSNDSYLPKELMASLDTAFAGQWLKNAIQFGMIQQNGEKLIEKLLGHQGLLVENTLEQLLTRGQRSSSSEEREEKPKSILRSIFKKLNINGRRQQNEEPTAMLYMRFRDQDYAMLPLDAETMPETIRQLFQEERFNIEQIQRFLAQGYHMNFHMGSFGYETSRKIPTSLGLPIEIKGKMPTIASITGQVKLQMEPKDQIKRVKLHLTIRPTVAAVKVVKVEAWTPIVNTGLKIVESVQVNLPVDTEIEIDTDKQSTEQLKIVVKTPKQMTRIVSLQSRPITYTRTWSKPVKTYPETEEKTIQGEEWDRVNTFDKEVGENALGLRMRVQGQWHRTPAKALAGTPRGPFAGNNHLQFYVAPGHQAPEAFVIKADAKLFERVEDRELTPEMDKFYETEEEQRFFKTERDQEREQEPKRSFDKFDQYAKSFRAQNPTQHQLNIKVETRGSPVQRKAQLALKTECSEEMRFCKWQLEIVRSPVPAGRYQESQPWTFQAKGQTLYPQMPRSLKELEELTEENQECTTKIDAEWGPQSRKDQFVYVKIQATRSQKQIELQRRSLYQQVYDEQREQTDVFSPVQQYEQLLKAATLTQYKVQAEYNVNAFVRNVTNKAFRMLQHYQLWNTEVAQVEVRNPEGRIHAHITVDPRNLQYVNVTVRMPNENVTITDMALPISIQPLNLCRGKSPVRSLTQLLKSVTGRLTNQQNKCVVSSDRVQTFDEVKYRAPLTTCYSVLAKDCSGYDEQPKFVVMMKKLSQETEGKKVKIITQENVIELEAKQQRYESEMETPVRVTINGKTVELDQTQTLRDHGHVVLRVEQQGMYVKVDLPEVDVQVYFDGFAATVKVSQMYRNAQCGLCGHFDGEQNDEFRTADNELTTDVEKFHRSFFHQDEECEINERVVDDEKEYEYQPFVWEHEDEQEQYRRNDEERDDEERQYLVKDKFEQRVQRPRQLTKVIESAHEICFSTKPVPECPSTTYATKFEEEKKVSFACLPRSDPEAHTLYRIASQDKIVQTEQLKASFVETVLIPQECRQF